MKNVALALLLVLVSCGETPTPLETPVKEGPTPLAPPASFECPIHFEKVSWCGELKWSKEPTTEGDSSFNLKIWNKADGSSIKTTNFSALLKMSCCGSITLLAPQETGEGTYEVKKVRFFPGEWDLILRVKNEATPDEKSIHFKFD